VMRHMATRRIESTHGPGRPGPEPPAPVASEPEPSEPEPVAVAAPEYASANTRSQESEEE